MLQLHNTQASHRTHPQSKLHNDVTQASHKVHGKRIDSEREKEEGGWLPPDTGPDTKDQGEADGV